MTGLINDVRVSWRRLLKTPGFTLGAVLTLALGIGASTAVFAVVSSVLLKPLPFNDAERLVFITREGDVGIPDGVDWRKESRTLEEIGLFAFIAFVVAFQGIHAILARAVGDQRRELGIRLALGATPRSLLQLVMRRGLKLTLAGLLFGILGSILLGRGLQSLLFEVQAADPLTFVAVAAVVGLAAMLSSYLPGREAARTAPANALRQE